MSQTDFLPFAKPHLNAAAIDEVIACLQSGWLATGPRVKRFEEALQTYLRAPYILALTSATAGLHLALLALNLKAGDEVITTPLTFIATLNTIVQANAKPVLVDIDAKTFNMDINKLEAAITKDTRAILPVHFAGLPVDLDPLYEIANRHGLRVIEDAAHAIGSHYKGRTIGSFGDTQVFSFHPNKNITTGEGGCIAICDKVMANTISQMRFHGIDREAWNRFAKTGNQEYDVVAPGYKYNMMDIQAALGLHQLPELETFIDLRTERANRYQEILSDWQEWTLPQPPSYSHRHAWHLYTPLLNGDVAGMSRDVFIQKMKENNIGVGLHYRAAHLYRYYTENFGFQTGDFPVAENVCNRILSLPLFPSMSFDEQDRVIGAMQKIFKRQ